MSSATDALVSVLMFFYRASHTSHHLVAIYAMGASASVIEAAYEKRSIEQRPAFESPEPITESNFWDHLADKRYQGVVMLLLRSGILTLCP